MIWNIKAKKLKIKEYPNLGDLKRRKRFAILPLKVEGKVIWLEKYIKVWVFKEISGYEEVEVTSGGLEDLATAIGAFNTRTIMKPYSFRTWSFHSRELIR